MTVNALVKAAKAGFAKAVSVYHEESRSEYSVSTLRNYLISETPAIETLDVENGAYKLVYADVQSGKTRLIVNSALLHANDGYNAVIVTRNIRADAAQLYARIIAQQRELYEMFDDYNMCKVVHASDIKADGSFLFTKRTQREGTIVIMMGNAPQFGRIDSKIRASDPARIRKTVMFIDEIDVNAKSANTALGQKLMTNDHWNIKMRVGVSATLMGFIYSDRLIDSTRLIAIASSDAYTGVDSLEIEGVATPPVEGEDLRSFDSICKILDGVASTSYKYKTNRGNPHPVIMLTKTETKIEKHTLLANELFERYSSNKVKSRKGVSNKHDWFHVVINSELNCMKIFCTIDLYKVEHVEREIGDTGIYTKVLDDDINEEREELDRSEDGDYYIFRGTVAEMLQMLKINFHQWENKAVHSFVINIISGHCLSRGISIVDCDYEYHVTSEIFVPSTSMDAASIIQSLRLCGKFGDSITQKLYTTQDVKDHIYAYYSLQTKMIEYLEEHTDENSGDMIKTILLDDIEAKLKRRIGRDQNGKMMRLKTMKTNGNGVVDNVKLV